MKPITSLLLLFILALLLLIVGTSANGQSIQNIQPGDSLEVRRQKENANFSFLNGRFTPLNVNSHNHVNKNFLDLLPSSLGTSNQFLAMNANGTGFEFRPIVAGDGISVTTVDGVTTIAISGGSGISTLNGLSGATQTFTNDTNVTIVSAGTAHAITWSGTLAGPRGGTNSAFFQVSGPSGSLKTFTFPNASATVLTDNAAVTVPQGGSGATTLTGILKGNGTSAFTAVTAPTGALVGDSDSQTLTNKTLDSAIITTFARLSTQAELRFFASSGSNYVGFKAPDSLAGNKVWKLPTADGTANQVMITDGSGNLSFATPPGASGGEANTASNVGAGSGWFKTKSSVDLQFKSAVAGSSKLSITSNTNDLTLDVVEANISRANLTGITPVSGGGSGATTLTGILKGNGTSPFTAVTAPTGTIVGDSDTQTLTNKTINVEGTGNVITTVSKVYLEAAGCDGTSASSMWDSFSTNAPVAACIVGTNTVKGVLDFADGATDLTAQRTIALPSDFTGNIDVNFKWVTTATTGNVIWGVATGCAGDGTLDDPSFNSFSDVTDAAKGTASQLNDANISNVTATGCTGGKLLHLKIARRLSQSGDTVAATARLIGFELTFRRAQ